MNNLNKSSQTFNILSNKPTNNHPIVRQTKAQKFFQQTVLPKSIKDDMMLSMNNPEIDGRPSKPVSIEVETPDENDPFYQIERVTNKIGNLVANYEEQAEQEHYLMLQELDSNFQINNYNPKEILDESRKAVDGLMNKTKVLKETQAGMLDDLSDWFSREEKSLKDADLTSNVALDNSIPVTTDDLLQVLQSSAGTSQQRVTKAIALHGDIVSHAFFAIHELQRKIKDQENLITDLKRQLSEQSSRRIQRQQSQLRPGSTESQHRLQEALSRISAQDETIKRLNERIEQLVGESVLQSRTENSSEKDETSILLKIHDAIANEMKLSKQESEINTLTDEIFKLKHDLQTFQADKSFLESQVLSFKEKIDLERTRYELLQKQYLELANEKQDSKLEMSEEEKKRINKEKNLMSKIVDLQNENQKLNDQIIKERKTAFQEFRDRIDTIKKEFETRELELKKRRLNDSMDSTQLQCFEALQNQHSDEMNLMKKNCEETIESMKKKFQEEKDSLERDFLDKLKGFQKQLRESSSDSPDVVKLIEMMQKRSDEKIIEVKKEFTEKIDNQRNDFQKHLNSLENEIKNKDIEIIRLKSEMDEYKSEKVALNLSSRNESIQNENQIHKLSDQVANYEAKMKEISESFESEKENAIEAVKSQYFDKLNKASEIEEINKKLKIEIDILKKQIQNVNNDSSFTDLMNNFTQQSIELNEAKESLNELNKKISESKNKILELTKENLKLKNDKDSLKFKTLDYVYKELFSLSKPRQSKQPPVIYEVDNNQHFLMKYEVAASIEPRLQEHFKKMQNNKKSNSIKWQISNIIWSVDIPFENNNESIVPKKFDVTENIEESTTKKLDVDENKEFRTQKIDVVNGNDSEVQKFDTKNIDVDENKEFRTQKIDVVENKEFRTQKIDVVENKESEVQKSGIEKVDLNDHKNENNKIERIKSFSLNSFEILDIEIESNHHQTESVIQHSDKKLSFSFPNHITFAPSINTEKHSTEEKSQSSNQEETPQTSRSIQLEFQTNDPFFINSESSSFSSVMNVAVQVEIEKKQLTESKAVLTHQPPLEIFNVVESEVTPDEPIVLDPSGDLLRDITFSDKNDEKSDEKLILLTKTGDVIDIPSISDVDSSTPIEAANAVSKIVMQETANISNKLRLVVSEIQSIDREPDPQKRVQMQETLGVQLDVEKDSLISQMRERITELEQMMKRVAERNENEKNEEEEVEVKVDDDAAEVKEVKNEVNIDKNSSQSVPVSLCSNSTQTDLVELESVGVVSTDFSSQEDIEPKSDKKMATTESFTLTENQCQFHSNQAELDISAPLQTLDIEAIKTVDLSTEFGVQFFNISPYSQRSRNEVRSVDKPSISLQISGKIECDYGDNRSFTKTTTNEQFSLQPKDKPSLSVTSYKNFVEVANEATEARGTSPLNGHFTYVDIGVSTTNKYNVQTMKNDSTYVKTSTTKLNVFKLVTRNILNVKPVSLKGDVRVAQIQQQAEQISDLKKHILRLQFTSPDSIGNVLSNVSSTMSLINDNINAMQAASMPSFPAPIILNKKVAKNESNSMTSTALLREAIEASSTVASTVIKDQAHLLSVQNDIFMRLNDASSSFLREMTENGGANAESQRKFIREVNELSSDFSDSLLILQSSLSGDNNVATSLQKAMDEVSEIEKFIDSLEKQILDLKLGKGKSHIVQQLADIRDELSNLIEGNSDSNHLLTNFKEAQKIIPKVALRGKNDNTARQAGASLQLDRIANLSKTPTSSENSNDDDSSEKVAQNDWTTVLQLLNEVVVMIDEHDAKQRARKIIGELNFEIKKLGGEVTRLQTELVMAGRDLQVADEKYSAHVKSLQRSLDTSKEHSMALERQLESIKSMSLTSDREARARMLENELDVTRLSEQKARHELDEANKKNAELVHENRRLTDDLSKSREMYSSLFNTCTDTQTTNDALKSKTEEIFKEAEIAKQRAAALEKMRQSASLQADDLAHQLTSLVSENAQLQNMLIKAQQKERELENRIIEISLKNSQNLNNNDDQLLNDVPTLEPLSQRSSNAKAIKVYQQRIDECMNLIVKNGNDIVSLRARHATDQKSIIMMQREMRRNQNDQKIEKIRYECAKKENGLLSKAIANRDETIRLLKREIERLRSILKLQGPLKQKMQLFEKEKINTDEAYFNAQKKLDETKIQRENFVKKNPNSTSYFDNLLGRQKATVARLEKRRKELHEIEEKKKIETLKAVAQVVNMAELQIPEEVIFNLMPKPKPVRSLKQRSKIAELQKERNKIDDQALKNDIEDATKYDLKNNGQKSTEFDTLNTYSSSFQNRQKNLFSVSKSYDPNLNDQSQLQYVKQPSYADTLQMIGSLVGQKSPRTLHEMLRNSRQSRIVMPVQPAPFHKRNDTKTVLTIKPMRK